MTHSRRLLMAAVVFSSVLMSEGRATAQTCNPACQAGTVCSAGACVACDSVYVDTSRTGGTPDGTSWANAFRDAQSLQDGLDEAASRMGSGSPPACVDIWVAKGTYMPTRRTNPLDDRTKTFLLQDNANLYGGFAGTESTLSARQLPSCTDGDATDSIDYGGKMCADKPDCGPEGDCSNMGNATILSGDLDADHPNTVDGGSCTRDDVGCPVGSFCAGGICIIGENVYRIVTYDTPNASVVFDGFVVDRGKADLMAAGRPYASKADRRSKTAFSKTTIPPTTVR